jgi:putative MATE family efflux protein
MTSVNSTSGSTVGLAEKPMRMPAAQPSDNPDRDRFHEKSVTANPLLTGRILPTLIRLSVPNVFAMLATAAVAIAETAYVGALGLPQLAGIALVFPMVMLQQMMSAGAMGGGISSAVSRALGAQDVKRAEALARHAIIIGGVAGIVFTAVFLTYGPMIYHRLGGRGASLEQASIYSSTVFLGAVFVWLMNTLASIVRGTGNMRIPSFVLLGVAALQVALGGIFGLGFGPVPRFGIAGVAMAQVVAYGAGTALLAAHFLSGQSRIRLRVAGPVSWDVFRDILKVGAIACVSPVQSVLTVLAMTGFVAGFGAEALAGYGIGARLEFLLVPITFAIGVSSLPMVGMAVGAGDASRARRVAWTTGSLAAAIIGAIGLIVTVSPGIWSTLFTANAGVLAVAEHYLRTAGPAYAFLGLGLALYFASMGSGAILGPVLAQTVRLIVISMGGWWLSRTGASINEFFLVVAASLAGYGLAAAIAVSRIRWTRA